MEETRALREQLIGAFTTDYMEKLFYFCLKKTGSTAEAEDLTHDTAYQVLSALDRGTCPANFSAWVWQIARNRYAVWAREKHRRTETAAGADIGDLVLEDENSDVLDEVIRAEQLALLRRELAFIKSDFRAIVVAHYIDGRGVRDIAATLSLSETAVKQRLFRARHLLKEGMDMAREFGRRSYQPQDIFFAASGSQPSGLPWTAVERQIPKNILLQASNNPSTAEELSMELGIALPYMEEEIALLCNATLLERQGEHYITNFFILDRDCSMEIYRVLRGGANERSRLIAEFMADALPEIRATGIAGDHIDDNTVRWWLVPDLIDCLIEDSVRGQSIYDPPVRANGETWGFVGYEITELPENNMMSHNGSGNENNMFWAYQYNDWSLWNQVGFPEYEEVLFLCDCVRNHRNTASFAEIEQKMWREIDGKYAHADENGNVIPDILVFGRDDMQAIHQLFRAHGTYAALAENVMRMYTALEGILKAYSHRVLHDNLGYYVRMEMYAMRMMSVRDLVDDGTLTLPADPTKSSLGMHLILK
ncbi:MAG: RNA polymerase sigma factor [Clostridia bacterium]|nr:RNA polymerase sigma factor [Clostridia bacterium]